MTYSGHVENGVVVLDDAVKLPEGAKVRVEVEASEKTTDKIPTLYDLVEPFVGVLPGPSDLAKNHDHYIYGTEKR